MSSYSWLLEATITSAIVAAIIVSIRLILKEKLSGKLKYYLWVIFLIRLMFIPLPESKISIYNLIPQKSSVQQEATLNNTENNSESTSNNLTTDNSSNNINSNETNNEVNNNNSNTIKKQTLSMSTILFGIYKAGVVAFLFIALLSYLLFIYRFRATDIVIEEAVLQRLEENKKRLNIKRKIQVIYGDTPFIYGICKVKLVIPKGLEVQELDAVILHELNHYKYGDLYINWVLIFLKAIYWFNPIVWIIFKQIREDCEVACDERVLESKFVDKKSYATVLFKNALKGNRYIVGTSSFSKEGSDIKGRIKLIQRFSKRKTLWITLGLVIFVIVGAMTLTNRVNNLGLQYSQEYIVGHGNVKGNVDVKSLLDKGIEFDIGANKYGYAVFKDPTAALNKLKADYEDGLSIIRKEFNLMPISKLNYKSYGMYGWQVTTGSEYEKEQARFVSSFIDIYENSFKEGETGSEITYDDNEIIREYLNDNVETWINDSGKVYSAFRILGTSNNEIYLWLLKQGETIGVTSLPVLLEFKMVEGTLTITNYKIPHDGGFYEKDIKEMFPKSIQADILSKDRDKHNMMISELEKEISEMKANKISSNNEEVIEIKEASIELNASIGADGPYLDFASDDIVIFHGYFGLFVYDLKENKIRNSLDLKYINCDVTQGDDYCEVTVHDGREVRLHNISTDDMYVFDVYENILIKKPYEKGDGIAQLFVTPEEITKKEFFTSYMSQKFKNGEIGYLALTDGTFRSFEYVRGDKRVKLFE